MNRKSIIKAILLMIIAIDLTGCSFLQVGKISKPENKINGFRIDKKCNLYGGIDYYGRCLSKRNGKDTLFVGVISSYYGDRRVIFAGLPYIPFFPVFEITFLIKHDDIKFKCGFLLRSHSDLSIIDKDEIKVTVEKNIEQKNNIKIEKINFYRIKDYDPLTGIWTDETGYNNMFIEISSDVSAKEIKKFSIDLMGQNLLIDYPIVLKQKTKFFYTPFVFEH